MYSYYSYDSLMSSYMTYYIIYAVISIVVAVGIRIGLGFLTRHMNEKKGYTGGFAWGFWLGTIGIIVVACKTDLRNMSDGNYDSRLSSQQPYQQPYQNQNPYQAQPQQQQPTRNLNGSNTDNTIETLTRLAKLHEEGILTDEEFEAKKAELLKNY